MCHCSPSHPFYPACHSSLPGPHSLYRAPMLGPLQLDLAVCSSFYCVNSGLPAATLSTTSSCYIFFFYFSLPGNFFLHISPLKTASPREVQAPYKGTVNARQMEA